MNQDSQEILARPNARIYFIGIGGIAMSAAACVAKSLGYDVLGSDSSAVYPPSETVLKDNHILYFSGYSEGQIAQAKPDLCVVSAGETENNPELAFALKNNLPRVGLAELLYEFSKETLRLVVTGTHGKSTTSAILGHLLKNLDDSSFMVGAVLQNYSSNFHKGSGHYFVFEGDEYKEQFDDPTPKFHYYKPDILVLTNLEYDHPDQFASMEDLEEEFRQLIANMPEDGLIVYNADNAALARLVHESNVSSVSFGLENPADFFARNINFGPEYTDFEVENKFSKDQVSELLGKAEAYQIQLPGKINVYNALAAIATLRSLGFGRESLILDLLSFSGLKRRFETIGKKNNITVIDDYAHHPTAVKQTLEAAKTRFPNSKIWAVFEPHTFSRTQATLAELVDAFEQADVTLLSEIYPARESVKHQTISSAKVMEAIKAKHPDKKILLVKNKGEALKILKENLKEGDVVVVMAVGSFNRLAYEVMGVI